MGLHKEAAFLVDEGGELGRGAPVDRLQQD